MKTFDAIAVGSGIAGLNFALNAAQQKQKVLIITKKQAANCGTNFAQGGVAAVLSDIDDYKKHIEDTLTAGCFHNNKKAVEYMVKNGPRAIYKLVEMGVAFAAKDGKLQLTREGGHSERRIVFVADFTGEAIEKALIENCRKNPFITFYENTFVADLLVKNKTCYGVQIARGGKYENIYAKVTALATGGIGQLYANTTNPAISTGDGIAMALRAGCKLKDLEFVQFHPTALNIKGKPRFLISEAVRGEGAYLVNNKGERFMLKVHKLAELAPRDIVSRAIFNEEKSGPVFLDLRHKNEKFLRIRFPKIFAKLLSYNISMAKDLIPVSPAAHYLCGGVKVDLHGRTNVKNLYVFGETAYTGVHGANRLASNSLLEALVFSNNAPDISKIKKEKIPVFATPKIAKLTAKEKLELNRIKKILKQIMWDCVGIVRTIESLKQASVILRQAQDDVHDTETLNMLQTGLLIIQAAQKRQKSLGCHYIIER